MALVLKTSGLTPSQVRILYSPHFHMKSTFSRCQWAERSVFHEYHDTEWGTPAHDDRFHFEMLTLEGAQAGLSWETILKKREAYREAFSNFDPQKVAKFSDDQQQKLLQNPGIVRNRLKISSTISNAQAFLEIQKEFGSFDTYIWSFTSENPVKNEWKSMKDLPASTPLSDSVSKDLRKRGFRFVGSTIIYSYLQAVGIVNDHEISCFRYKQLS